MLDDEQRDPELAIGLAEPLQQAVDQRRIDARGRLVEQEHLRLAHQRHGEFEQLLLAEGQIAGAQVALRVEADEAQQVFGLAFVTGSAAAIDGAPIQLGGRQADEHVLHARHPAVDARLLERPQQAQTRDLRHAQPGDVAPLESDRSAVDRMLTDDGVEERRLARTVRPDQPVDLPFGDGEVDVVVRDHSAERLADVLDLENRAAHAGPCEGVSSTP